jgi:hypothetical protein
MKKNQKLQITLIGLASLFIGFLLGMAISSITPSGDELTGTIGRVDQQRNVQITENDIILRNDLADNLDIRDQYVDYLSFFYIKALRNSNDLFFAMNNAAAVDDFADTFDKHTATLETYSAYLEMARTDILEALEALTSIEDERNRPMVELLNQAFNAIHRIRNNSDVVLDFMTAINTFMEKQDVFYPELADAHDVMAINSLESAIAYKNKPMLHFLKNTNLKNDDEDITKLITGLNNASALNELNLRDMTNLDIADALRNDLNTALAGDAGGIQFLGSDQIEGLILGQIIDHLNNQAGLRSDFDSIMHLINNQATIRSDFDSIMHLINNQATIRSGYDSIMHLIN